MAKKKITNNDLAVLARYDANKQMLDLSDPKLLLSAASAKRLMTNGYMEKTGKLTEKGLKIAEPLRQKLEEVKKGVPVDSRKSNVADQVFDSERVVLQATYAKKSLLVDGAFLCLADAKMAKGMEKLEDNSVIKDCLKKVLKEPLIEVEPHTYQITDVGGTEIIWLSDAEESHMLPIQARYYDYLQKMKGCKWYAQLAKNPNFAVLKSKNGTGGFQGGVKAVVMRYDSDGVLPRPKMLWRA